MVKLALYLIKHQDMRTYWGGGGRRYSSTILEPFTRLRSGLSFTHQLLYPGRKWSRDCMDAVKRKNESPAPAGNRTPAAQAHAPPLLKALLINRNKNL
jgi:hypothetical protein